MTWLKAGANSRFTTSFRTAALAIRPNWKGRHPHPTVIWVKLTTERKLLLCALARNSLDAAVSIIHKMSQQSWTEPMTAYLAFKVAVRVEDREMAERCLETVARAPDHMDYLGACIAESQKAGDIHCAIAALKKLQERYEHKEPNPIHLPALFRCTIRLLNLVAGSSGVDGSGAANDLCQQFEAGECVPHIVPPPC